MKARLIALAAAIVLACCALASCDKEASSAASSSAASSSTVSYSTDPIGDYINIDDVTEIEVTAERYIAKPQDDETFAHVSADETEQHKIVDILGGYSLKVKDSQEHYFGFSYAITVKQKDRDDVYIVIYSDDLTNIPFISVDPGDRSVNYDLTSKATVDDFRFLFEKG